jgi:hypothetical protein
LAFAALVAVVTDVFHIASAAVTLSQANSHVPHDIRKEPISRATFTYRDKEPVLVWGEATADASAVNSDVPVAAYATYDRQAHNKTGWGQLWISTTNEVPMLEAMFAAGMFFAKQSMAFFGCQDFSAPLSSF